MVKQNQAYQYKYDAEGKRIEKIQPNGTFEAYRRGASGGLAYDPFTQMTTQVKPSASEQVAMKYDAANERVMKVWENKTAMPPEMEEMVSSRANLKRVDERESLNGFKIFRISRNES
ncbi:MAG: hypothetical protein SNJ55_13375 [Chloroherpetonaceae bacterium]